MLAKRRKTSSPPATYRGDVPVNKVRMIAPVLSDTSAIVRWRSPGPRCNPTRATSLPGRTCGKEYPSPGSGVVRTAGSPPSADTRQSLRSLANTILPSLPQLAPRTLPARQIRCGWPPATETFWITLFPSKPSHLLSGEKNGLELSAPPGTRLGSSSLVERRVQTGSIRIVAGHLKGDPLTVGRDREQRFRMALYRPDSPREAAPSAVALEPESAPSVPAMPDTRFQSRPRLRRPLQRAPRASAGDVVERPQTPAALTVGSRDRHSCAISSNPLRRIERRLVTPVRNPSRDTAARAAPVRAAAPASARSLMAVCP